MKKLFLTKLNENGNKDSKYYRAVCTENDNAMLSFPEESIFDAWSYASQLFIPDQEEDAEGWEISGDNLSFNFNEFEYIENRFEAIFNDDKNGYDIFFDEGSFIHLDTYALNLFLSLNEKKDTIFVCKDAEYEKMMSEQKSLIDDFISQVNKLKEHYA